MPSQATWRASAANCAWPSKAHAATATGATRRSGQYELALPLTEQALALMCEPEDKTFETWVLLCVGNAHIELGNFESGHLFIDRAIAIDEQRGLVLGAAQLLRELGNSRRQATCRGR